MKELKNFKEEIHKCSKCGLCQSVCPIYHITGNDCCVSRGQFIMLKGLIKGDLKMTTNLNRYLNLCLKCGKCSHFCPAGIDAVDIIISAKHEYFKTHFFEKIISWIQKYFIFGLISILSFKYSSKYTSDKKVVYFGGCGAGYSETKAVTKILNKIGYEVVTPSFSCCGMPFFARGDIDNFKSYMNSYIKTLKKHDIKDIVTTCASCEKMLKSYIKWCESEEDKEFLSDLKIKNIYEYLKNSNIKLTLKKHQKVTYHKPCSLNNYDDIKQILNSVENLEYIESDNYDKCCGLNGLFKFSDYKIFSEIFKQKRESIISTNAKYVLTDCFGCEIALKAYSLGKYKTFDLIKFLSKNI